MKSQLLRQYDQSDKIAVGADTARSNSRLSLVRRFKHFTAWVALIFQVRRERKQLATLSDHALRDIGITREQADSESYRGLASIPTNRLKRTGFRRR